MNLTNTLSPNELLEFLLHIAPSRPVFIWGPPGVGKTSLVQLFAESVGLECISLLGSQIAPEDVIGVPQIAGEKSFFCPPRTIARDQPYVLFLDELNACSQEVQKAFYSLIHEHRIGEYKLPRGSVVIGAGNRAQDSAIVKPMSSALINRMIHVVIRVDHRQWLDWAYANGIHPIVIEYIQLRPDHLWVVPPKHEEPFSTPRSWHTLSDALHCFGNDINKVNDQQLEAVAMGCLSSSHAIQFRGFIKVARNKYALSAIIKGDARWPSRVEDRDVLYFLAQSFRAQLIKELPRDKNNGDIKGLTHRSKTLLKDLAAISHEIAQLVISDEDGQSLPEWFMVEIVRDIPRLVEAKK